MIILDTNVVSALMRADADPAVQDWLNAQHPGNVWLNAVLVYEIRFGLACIAEGTRRRALEQSFATMLRTLFTGRIAPLDHPAADAAGRIAAEGRRAGRPMDVRDAMIGGIAVARKAALATSNTRHFRHLGVRLIDPWGA
ncbi:MAG TPA: type II toxin-antitoxin system VapC family toxin [Acetobacteraceae bacterium]|nr:type II toxin-antitoxin system VapC family toxin [Acetobacteraceae bacterium]